MPFLSKFGFDLGKIHHRLPWVPKRAPEIVFVVPFIVEGWREGFQVQRFEGDILPELGQQVCSTMGTNTSNQLNHWVIDSFSHCFLVFLFRSFVTQSPISCISWLIRSFIRWFIHPLIHSFIHAGIRSFVHWFQLLSRNLMSQKLYAAPHNFNRLLHVASFSKPRHPDTSGPSSGSVCARRDTSSNSGSTSRAPWSAPRCPSLSSCQSSWSSSDSPPNCSPHNLSKHGIFKEKTPTKPWRWTR